VTTVSGEKSSGRLLIIDEDARLVETLHQHFEFEGYKVFFALTCREGVVLAQTAHPNLILLAAGMKDMSELEAFRALRHTPRTSHIPVMVIAGRDEATLQNKILEEGAYDFIEKPLDLDILALRVRNALRRAEREGITEPRTGLPTGRLIEERLKTLQEEQEWCRIELKIDGFGVFRDRYGFVTANEALRFAGNLVVQIVDESGGSADFVGHRAGTEEFVIITTSQSAPALGEAVVKQLTQELRSFYDFMERDQGYVLLENGAGGFIQRPLMSAQVTVTCAESASNSPASRDVDPWVDTAEEEDNKPGSPASGSAFEW
jgi:PleD family two-component response regulator